MEDDYFAPVTTYFNRHGGLCNLLSGLGLINEQKDKLIEKEIIIGCKKGDKTAVKTLYEMYAPIFRGICLRYTGNLSEAEDVMHEGFIKIITKISQFKGKGSFEGWLKRIIINTAITHIKNNKKVYFEVTFCSPV